jgi:hypothetical protein
MASRRRSTVTIVVVGVVVDEVIDKIAGVELDDDSFGICLQIILGESHSRVAVGIKKNAMIVRENFSNLPRLIIRENFGDLGNLVTTVGNSLI